MKHNYQLKYEKLSPYRMGWVMVIFDLPVITHKERLEYSRFRKFLLDDGFMMLQYSVYVIPCVSKEHMDKYAQRVIKEAPNNGFVKILFFTDKQWEQSYNIIGYREDEKKEIKEQDCVRIPDKGVKDIVKNVVKVRKDNRCKDLSIPPQIIFW